MVLADKLAHLAGGAHVGRWGRRITGLPAWVRRARVQGLGLSALASLVLVTGFVVAAGAHPPARPGHRAHMATRARAAAPRARTAPDPPAAAVGNSAVAPAPVVEQLPTAVSAPVAAPAALVSAPPLATREDFAFAPYWTLPQSATFTLTGLSTIAYFSVDVNPNGTLDESGPGWNGFESQALSSLITRAHAADERVVLTLTDFDQRSLDALTSSPTAATALAAAVIPLLQAKSLDGVNFDFEGTGAGDQAGLTALIASVSGALRAADPHWQITMDTYASSAGDPGGFYDIPALAPYVDAFFVMAYELNLAATPSAGSPLTSGDFSDLSALEQYTAVVPASKVILGTPFFGIDWPTSGAGLGSPATGAAKDIADSTVSTDPQYWDAVTDTGWTSYLVGSQWHQAFFEDPAGLVQVARLAAQRGARGVGIWALGMGGDEPAMIAALDGFVASAGPVSAGPQGAPSTTTTTTPPRPAAPGPASSTSTTAAPTPTSTSVPASSTTTDPLITGTYDGKTFDLTPVPAGGVNKTLSVGNLSDLSTTDPAYSCLEGTLLPVYLTGGVKGHYVAVATAPADCVTENFSFG